MNDEKSSNETVESSKKIMSKYEEEQNCRLKDCQLALEEREVTIECKTLALEESKTRMDFNEEAMQHDREKWEQDKKVWARDQEWFDSHMNHHKIYADHVDKVNTTNAMRLKIEASKANSWERIARCFESALELFEVAVNKYSGIPK